MPATRRLAAILAADVAGYSRLMGLDEAGTAQALREHRGAADPLVAEHGGRIVKTTGDGVLIEFGSVVGAVECALALQQLATERNASVRSDRRMEWRIGIHLGDVLVEGDDILGDGVNIAARLEGIAEPGGICISDDAFRQVRGKVAAEFTDIGEQSLKNIARPLRVYSVRPTSAPEPRAAPAAGLPLPDKPSIAVLPFANMSGDPEQAYFADGMVEEIITALSRIRWLFVIARNSSFTYKGQAIDVKQVGRELGVLYVLEGSVRKAGNRVRITAQLLDATTAAHLWADHFNGTLEDIFQLQDNVASSVAGVIEPTLQAAEHRRSVQRPTDDLTAYDLFLQAYALYSVSREGVRRALELAERALERDPNYGSALAVATRCHTNIYACGWTKDLEATRKEGIELARRALRVAGDDPFIIDNAAISLALFGEDIATTITLVERSLQLNPNFALGWFLSGQVRLWAGRYDLALEHIETSIRLNPRERRHGNSRHGTNLLIGMGHFFARRTEKAAEMFGLSLQENSEWPPTLRFMASCLAHMGRLKQAQEIVKRLRAITPVVIPTAEHWG